MSPAPTAPLLISKPDLEHFFSTLDSKIEASIPCPSTSDLGSFFNAVGNKVEQAETQQRIIDKTEATGFNIFDLLDPDENKLSDILADLFDPRGTHGQGDLFLQLLLKQLGIGSDSKRTKKATVQREAPTHGILKFRRRMDIFIEAGTLIAIENKVDAQEQTAQVSDYLDHLDYCTRGHSIQSILIYLTPNGRDPDSISGSALEKAKATGSLYCWSYQHELRDWLEACISACEAQKIKFFLLDFISYIESTIKRDSVDNEEEEFHEE